MASRGKNRSRKLNLSIGKSLSKKFRAAGMPKEVRVVCALLVLIVVLYIFQFASSPSFFKSHAKGITGFVAADVQKSPEPVQPVPVTEAKKQEEPAAVAPAPAPVQSKPIVYGIKIVSPEKGSRQSPGFFVNIEVSEQVLTCYYRVDDNGQLTWDRRMKPCKTELPVAADHCKTSGGNTCRVQVEAYDANGNGVGKDSAFYSIK